jgi:hypothetical protein
MRIRGSRVVMATLCVLTAGCGTAELPTSPDGLPPARSAFVPLTPTTIVTRSLDAGPGSLREAVANAAAGDVIGFADSIAVIQFASAIETSIPLTIQGRAANHVTLDGMGTTRLLRSTAALTIRGMTLTGSGPRLSGGAVALPANATLTLEDVDFTRNESLYGPAVYAWIADLTNVRFLDNTADAAGGAIFIEKTLTARGATFLRNTSSRAGAIQLMDGATATITDSHFESNSASLGNGGAIGSSGGALTISNTTFVGNSASDGGGAIVVVPSAQGAQVAITGGAFADNDAGEFGGALDVTGDLTTDRTSFAANRALSGAGIMVRKGDVRITDSRFESNVSEQSAGAIYSLEGLLDIEGSDFIGNRAASAGAVAAESAVRMTIVSSLFSGNAATGSAGAVFSNGELSVGTSRFLGNSGRTGGGIISNGLMTITQSEFVENTAVTSGGGFFAGGGVSVQNSTFSLNSAEDGAAIGVGGSFTNALLTHVTFHANAATQPAGGGLVAVNAAKFTIVNSLLSGTRCGLGTFTFGGNNRSDSNSCAVPSNMVIGNVVVAPLAFNGGLTRTMALEAGNLAIDAGTACTLPIDQRGVSRPQFASCDLGAYEFDVANVAILTIDASGTVNSTTGVAYVTGTISCTRAGAVMLNVSGEQLRKVGKVNTTVKAGATLNTECNTAPRAWSAALAPTTGAFGNSPMNVSAAVAPADVYTTGQPVTRTGVKMTWTKR